MILMYKIGIIGDEDTVLAFKALGIDTFPVEDAEEAKNILNKTAEEDYGVVFLTEQLAQYMEETIERYYDKMLPAIILIPNNKGSLGIGLDNIKSSVEKAIGVDILFEEGEDEE